MGELYLCEFFRDFGFALSSLNIGYVLRSLRLRSSNLTLNPLPWTESLLFEAVCRPTNISLIWHEALRMAINGLELKDSDAKLYIITVSTFNFDEFMDHYRL